MLSKCVKQQGDSMDFLRNIFDGASTIIDVFPHSKEAPDLLKSTQKNDREALAGDWYKVGKDLRKSLEKQQKWTCKWADVQKEKDK